MFKCIGRWLVKKFITVDTVKDIVFAANLRLSEKVRVDGEAKKKALGIAGEVGGLVTRYLNALSDDGRIDSDEVAVLNEAEGAVIEKYVSKSMIDSVIDDIFS